PCSPTLLPTRSTRAAIAARRPNSALWRTTPPETFEKSTRSPIAAIAASVDSRMRRKCSTSAGSTSTCCARIEIAEMPSMATESSMPIFSMSAIPAAPLTGPASAAHRREVQRALALALRSDVLQHGDHARGLVARIERRLERDLHPAHILARRRERGVDEGGAHLALAHACDVLLDALACVGGEKG